MWIWSGNLLIFFQIFSDAFDPPLWAKNPPSGVKFLKFLDFIDIILIWKVWRSWSIIWNNFSSIGYTFWDMAVWNVKNMSIFACFALYFCSTSHKSFTLPLSMLHMSLTPLMKGHNKTNSTACVKEALGHTTWGHQPIIWIFWFIPTYPFLEDLVNSHKSLPFYVAYEFSTLLKGHNKANSTGCVWEA